MFSGWQKPFRGTRLNLKHPLARGYIGWIFNELSGGLCVSEGGSRISTVFAANAPRWEANYLNFDTGVEYLENANLWPFLSPGGDSFSVTIKYRSPSSSSVRYIFCVDYGTGATNFWVAQINASHEWSIGLDDGTAYQGMPDETFTADNNQWHTSTSVIDRNTGYCYHYHDGEYSTAVEITAGNVNITSGPVTIGGRCDHNNTRDYIGDLEFIHIHMGVALSESQVLWLHREPYCMFEQPSRAKYFYIGVPEYSLLCESGSFNLTGQTAGTLKSSKLPLDPGSFSFSGVAAGVLKSSLISAGAGSYTITGQTIGTLKSSLIPAESGSFDLTGIVAGILKSSLVSALTGSIDVTGKDASLLFHRLLSMGFGNYEITGHDAELNYITGYILPLESGLFSINGLDVDLNYFPVPAEGSFLPTYRRRRR